MKNNKPIIGILGGMGPRSTSPFIDLIIDQCQTQYKAKNDIDFPHIIVYSLPTPFYINKPINDCEMRETICEGLKKLESMGVDFIAMPCNTAHKYFEKLQSCISIPLLNIVEATLEKFPTAQKSTIFATETTINGNLYQSHLKKFILKPEWQAKVNTLIQYVKLGKSVKKSNEIINYLSEELKQENIETIIIGCTDISKIVKKMKSFFIVDSSEALAEKTIKTYLDLI